MGLKCGDGKVAAVAGELAGVEPDPGAVYGIGADGAGIGADAGLVALAIALIGALLSLGRPGGGQRKHQDGQEPPRR